ACQICVTTECILTAARIINNMNMSADPGEDFNEFACGRYIKESEFPDGQSFMASYTAVYYQNIIFLRSKFPFYQSCVDEAQIEAVGLEPYFNDTEFTDDWPTLNPDWNEANFDLNEVIARYMAVGVEPIFSITVSYDMEDSTINVLKVRFACLFARGSDSGRRVVVKSSMYALSFSHFYSQFGSGNLF
ncbi:unnamed protein product, partial [Candidula unifasciata]